MISNQRHYYYVHLLAFLLLCSSSTLLYAQPPYDSSAKNPSSWINQPSIVANNTDINTLTPILIRENIDGSGASFVCGFYCNHGGSFRFQFADSKDCIFGILISQDIHNESFYNASVVQSPQLVWSANRNSPVQVNATVVLSQDGDLILTNSDGTVVWSSDTKGRSVAGMNLTEDGNLVLFGLNNEPIWQSFDYPTDSLLLRQKLMRGKRLTSSVSASNQGEGLLYLSVENSGLAAYVKSDPPQRYYFHGFNNESSSPQYVEFTNGSFHSYNFSSAARFIKLGPDGHLKVFGMGENDWTEVADLLEIKSTGCGYPMVCGRYGLCSEGFCNCDENFFTQLNAQQPNLGCSPITPISCDHSQDHTLLELRNTYYFAFNSDNYDQGTLVEDCKNRCLSNCSCKAALYVEKDRNSTRPGFGCLLLNEVFSIADNQNSMASRYNTTMYIKVQHPYPYDAGGVQHPVAKASRRRTIIIASSLASIFGVLSVIGSCLVIFRIRNKNLRETQEDFLNHVPGMAAKYSYKNLKAATKDFRKKLGEGGFAAVYEGELTDGTKVAVKCLDGLAKVKDSFLVEVKAIGSINHVNLVKLIGFCFEKSHRLLVYEHMANRSLDGWIFPRKENQYCLPWHSRVKIISDVAKGLAYLHEDCSQKIIHLDVKPQNILLDHNFNAKISDFGLSKLIEKDQSRVVTRMRGTPGYMAPEWLTSIITEKVDVYSFGVVMLEIICGRKNLDWSKTEDETHLLSLFKRKAEEENLEELVEYSKSEDMLNHMEEAVEMMGIAAWCLQGDFTKRPSMSLVVKVLEGSAAAETDLDYDFFNRTMVAKMAAGAYDATEILPSPLSGPR